MQDTTREKRYYKRLLAFVMLTIIAINTVFYDGAITVMAGENDELHISGQINYDDEAYKDDRPSKDTLKSHLSFIVTCDGEEVSTNMIKVESIETNDKGIAYKIKVDQYDPDRTYKVKAVLEEGSSTYDYTFTTAEMASDPAPVDDENIFYADAKTITAKPVVTEATNVSFQIEWWDSNDVNGKRPTNKEAFLAGCKLQYSLDGTSWEYFDQDMIDQYKLKSQISISDDWEITCSGVAKAIPVGDETKELQYRMITPQNIDSYVVSNEGDHPYRYYYSADITGKIKWNDYASGVTEEQKKNLVKLTVYKVNSEGGYDTVSAMSGVMADYIQFSNTDTSLWDFTISKLPTYDDAQNRITYVVKEEPISDYETEYDNKSISTATDICYDKGYIINTIQDNITLDFNVQWVEPDSVTSRPAVTYTLWRYAKDKHVPNTATDYDYSTAAMVTYMDNGNRKTISETHDFGAGDTWTMAQDSYVIHLGDGGDYTLPKYDEEGYEYVYFLKQTDENMSSDLEDYEEVFYTDAAGNNKITNEEEKVIYANGLVKNIYQEQMDLGLTKLWTNVKTPADYSGTKVELVITRSVDGVVDADYEEHVTLPGFSNQLNKRSTEIETERYNLEGKEYQYIVKEVVTSGGATVYDGTAEGALSTYTLNGHLYTCNVTETKDANGIPKFQVENKGTATCEIKVVKKWGSTYNATDYTALPETITAHLKQNGAEYAKITINRSTDTATNGTATVVAGGQTIDNIPVTFDPAGKTWTLDTEGRFLVPYFDNNNVEYSYTITEETVAAPTAEGHWYYTTAYHRENVDNEDVLTTTVINNFYTGDEYNYKICWLYKKWMDDGDPSNRSAITAHAVILGADGKIVYDLADETDRNAFITAISAAYCTAHVADDTATVDAAVEKMAKIVRDNAAYSLVLSEGNDWKNSLEIPRDLETYAKLIDLDYSYSFVEYSMKSVSTDTAYTDSDYKNYVYNDASDKYIHNDKQKYIEEIQAAGGSSFNFQNTRIANIDVKVNLDWRDFDDFVEVRPAKAVITLYSYVDSETNTTQVSVNTVSLDSAGGNVFSCEFPDLPEYDENGKVIHYIITEAYKDEDGNTVNMKQYEVGKTSDYQSGTYDKNSTLTYELVYKLSDEVSTRNITFYKIWRDEAKKNTRPDLALKLYKDVSTKTNDSETIQEKVYCGYVDSKCTVLDPYVSKYSFYSMPEYKVIRVDGEITGIEKYDYFASEVINTTPGTYYSHTYLHNVGVMGGTVSQSCIPAGTDFAYDKITNWADYAKGTYNGGYDGALDAGVYADEGGCFVNGISENLAYTGTKSWINLPPQVTSDDYPYVEIYFFQNKTRAQIAGYIGANNAAKQLRDNSYVHTSLDVSKMKFKDAITVPKYDATGAAYQYDIIECVYQGVGIVADPEPAAADLKILPGFIMTSKAHGQGTAISLRNEFDTSGANARELTIEKNWLNNGATETANTEAEFNIYRIEKLTTDPDITTVDELKTKIADGTAAKIDTVYVKNTASGSGTTTIQNLPVYSARGTEYVYFAEEVPDYQPSYTSVAKAQSSTGAVSTVLTTAEAADANRYIRFGSIAQYISGIPQQVTDSGSTASYQNEKNTAKATITGTVKWVDYVNAYGTRPNDKMVQISVYRNADGQSDSGHTTGNAESKTKVFDPATAVALSTTDAEAAGYDKVFKIAADAAGNKTGKELYIKWTKNDDETWTYKITGAGDTDVFDVYSENGKPWKYSGIEEKTTGADHEYFGDNYTGYGVEKASTLSGDKKVYTVGQIVNTLNSNVKIQKRWSDTKDQYTFRPSSIKIKFQYKLTSDTEWKTYAADDGTDEFELNQAGTWQKQFVKLPKQTASGNSYEYRVVETNVSIKVGDTTRNITVNYYNGSTQGIRPTEAMLKGTLSTETEGDYYLGKAGSYTAKVPKTIPVNGTGSVLIYNTLEDADVISLPITKKWEDDDAYKSIARPKKIYVKIQRMSSSNNGVTLNSELAEESKWENVLKTDGVSPLILTMESSDLTQNEWTKTYPQLPKINPLTSETYYYRAIETDKDGNPRTKVGTYTTSANYTLNPDTDTYSTEITNTYVSSANLKVKKLWEDAKNQDGKRPATVSVDLYYHDFDKDSGSNQSWKKFKTITLGKQADDTYSWSEELEDLPLYYYSTSVPENPKLMEYKAVEGAVANYTTKYKDASDTVSGAAIPVVVSANAATAAEIDIENIYTPEKGKMTVSKNWIGDTSIKEASRPDTLTVALTRTFGEEGSLTTEYYNKTSGTWQSTSVNFVLEKDDWKLEIEDLPLFTNRTSVSSDSSGYSAGTSYKYTYHLTEISRLNGYKNDNYVVSSVLVKDTNNKLTLTNVHQGLDIILDYTWDDFENSMDTRRKFIVVIERSTDGTTWSEAGRENVNLTQNTSHYEFLNQPGCNGNNVQYQYRAVLKEKDVSATNIIVSDGNTKQNGCYSISNNGMTRTDATASQNATISYNVTAKLPVIQVKGEIEWEDDDDFFKIRPSAADYTIGIKHPTLAGDLYERTTSCNVSVSDNNTYTYVFENMPKYDKNGNIIKYSTYETVSPNYTASSQETGAQTATEGGTDVTYTVKEHQEVTVDQKDYHEMTTILNELHKKELKLTKTLSRGIANTIFKFNLYVTVDGHEVLYNPADTPYTISHNQTISMGNLMEGVNFRIEEIEANAYKVTEITVKDSASADCACVKDLANKTVSANLTKDMTVGFANEGKSKADIMIVKNWAGEDGLTDISKRPENLYFVVERTIVGGALGDIWKTVTVSGDGTPDKIYSVAAADCILTNDDNTWSYIVPDLPAFSSDELGGEFVYRVVETDAAGNRVETGGQLNKYTVTYSNEYPSVSGNYSTSVNEITNTCILGAPLKVRVDWVDDDNRDGIRPDKVEVELQYYDAATDTWISHVDLSNNPKKYTVSADGDWKLSFGNLPVYDISGNLIKYRVSENAVSEYTTTYDPQEVEISLTEERELVVINTHLQKVKSLQIIKYWRGDDTTAAVTRPANIAVTLSRNAVSANGTILSQYSQYWKSPGVWTNQKDEAGTIQVTGSSTSSNWVYTLDGSLSANKLYVYAFTKDSVSGPVPYTYTIDEIKMNGYTITTDDTVESTSSELTGAENPVKLALVNELDKIDVKAEIAWEDYNNSLNTRKEVTLTLQRYINGAWEDVKKDGNSWSISANDTNGWKAEFKDQPTHDKNGNVIKYRVVVDEFDHRENLVAIEDTDTTGDKQHGRMSVYEVSTNTIKTTEDTPYYLTKINCALKYLLAIDNTTENPTDKTSTDVGGRVKLIDDIDISSFNPDNISTPTEADKVDYERAKIGAIWESDEYWQSDETIVIQYTDTDGNKKTLEAKAADLLAGNAPDEVKHVFPEIKLYKKDGKYALFLTDDVLTMPEKAEVLVKFNPIYGIMNLTEGQVGGTVKNSAGTASTSTNGVPNIDRNEYTNNELSAQAEKGYVIDMKQLYVSYMGDYGIPITEKIKMTINGNHFTAVIPGVVSANGLRKDITVTGTLNITEGKGSHITALNISSDCNLPLVFGVVFKKPAKNSKSGDDSEETTGYNPVSVITDAIKTAAASVTDSYTNAAKALWVKLGFMPATSDQAPILFLLIILLLSGGTAAGILIVKRKKQKNS